MAYPTHNQNDDAVIGRNISRAYIERDQLAKDKLKDKQSKQKSSATRKTVPAEELINIAEESQEELISVTTVFPFNLFPDTITIDRQKISIIDREFFRTANIVSVKISDILNIESHLGPFFGSIKVYSKYFVDNFYEVNFLTRKDATSVHQLLQGYIIAIEKGIDCSKIDRRQLIILLNELGHPSSR